MEELKFNGKKVKKGTAKRSQEEPRYIHYALVGASPPVRVEETVYPGGKSTFYVQAHILDGRVRRKRGVTRPRVRRLANRRRFGVSYSGYGLTLPAALRKLEKNMTTTFKVLAKTLGYELEG